MEPVFTRRTVELSRDVWWKYAAWELDNESFLLHQDDSGNRLTSANQTVAIIQQGCAPASAVPPAAKGS